MTHRIVTVFGGTGFLGSRVDHAFGLEQPARPGLDPVISAISRVKTGEKEDSMTRPLTNFEGVQITGPQRLTRTQRLERWAIALERLGDKRLQMLRAIEHQHFHERRLMREHNSPLTVAFEEPVLRSCGLQADTIGEAQPFFDLSEWDLHSIVCECHSGSSIRASVVATRVRTVMALTAERTTAFCAGIIIAVLGTALLLLLTV